MPRIIIVDEKDNPIGLKDFGTLDYQDIYRVSGLWLTDVKSGDILIAQRKWTKHNDPGKWPAAAAGTVDEGETYRVNMVKEVEEELGLTDLKLVNGPKQFVDDGKHKFFLQWYLAKVNKDDIKITIEEEEVEEVKWIPKDKLIEDVQNNPQKYTPSTENSLRRLGII